MYNQINSLAFRQFLLDLSEQPVVQVCRHHLQLMRNNIRQVHAASGNNHPRVAAQLIEGFAFDLDTLVLTLWSENQLHIYDNLSLIATGGYGRMQLHPYSDIDLLVLHNSRRLDQQCAERIAAFIRNLWDCGLNVGSSIRSLSQAKSDIGSDLTLLTSLLESRQLGGIRQIHVQLINAVYNRVLDSHNFLRLKLQEMQQRHARFDNVSYLLEPNIKNSPGALRDIHCIFWHSQVAVRGLDPERLLEEELITHAGLHKLIRARNLLISVRLALHLLCGKAEDRLLIDYQRELAGRLGYKKTHKPAVEEFMQRVYKSMLVVSAINDSLGSLLRQRFASHQRTRAINKDFYALGDTLMCYDPACFRHNPGNLLLCFTLIAQTPGLRQLGGKCASAVYENSLLIDEVFRHNPVHKQYFIEILKARRDVSAILEQMKRAGVLGRYLQVFGAIIGQLQHDLVHVFTVDAHTLRVMHNMHNLLEPQAKQDNNLRIPAQVANQLPEFPLLLIAGLFHDVAKGRGGNHSLLGAVDVQHFAREHNLPEWQVTMLGWLVAEHLFMSATAQQQDVDDPEVIQKFAGKVGDKLHLDYLYVLTVTDIMSTNPSLWNAWRAALLTKLYQNTLMYLSERASYSGSLVNGRKQTAMEQIPAGLRDGVCQLWQQLPNDFFHSKSSDNIVLHSTMMVRQLQRTGKSTMLLLRPTHSQISLGATELSVFCPRTKGLFARVAIGLHRVGVNVLDARVFSLTRPAYTLISFIALGKDGKPIPKRHFTWIRQAILKCLSQQTENDDVESLFTQLLNPRQRKIWFTPKISLTRMEDHTSQLGVDCLDFPGLLAIISYVLQRHSLGVVRATVTTLGDRAVDRFTITSDYDDQVSQATEKQLTKELHKRFALVAASCASA